MASTPPADLKLPWWKERMVWLIVGLPVTAVLASFATLIIASRDPDDIVKEGYAKTGMATVSLDGQQQAAAKLGLVGAVSYQAGLINLTLAGTIDDAALTLTLVHPTQDAMDIKIPLTRTTQGIYQARVELSGQGKRLLILEPADQRWRLKGEWRAPFLEETSLHTGA